MFEPDTEPNGLPSLDEEEISVMLAMVKLILLKALSWYFAHEHMSKQIKGQEYHLKGYHLRILPSLNFLTVAA